MNKLNEIVDFYLKSETNYALMITGEWGVGKTYYFNNILKNQIKKTSTFKDNERKYKPIYISLFGLKSVEEIQTSIFLNLYPLLKNKTIKLAANIGKVLIKGIMNLKNLGDYYDFVSEIDIDEKDWIKLNELVICFDDFERLSDKLNIEEFIGFVNTLVENENVKVVLIANENKIKKENYHALKEKVVGNSIEFIPDFKDSFNNLINIKFQDYKIYHSFLKQNSDYIYNAFFKHSSNLRILSFSLTYFHLIHSEYQLGISKLSILKTKEIEILEKLFKFSIAIAIEYKQGNISYTKKEELNNIGIYNWKNLLPENTGTWVKTEEKSVTKKSYRQDFIDKYYIDDKYYFFNSIYEFYTGGGVLNGVTLISEIKNAFHIEDNKILPQYEILNDLDYPNVFSISEGKNKELITLMLNYAFRGDYDLKQYLTVFILSTRFGNPLKFNIKKLEKKIIQGMKLGKKSYDYIHSLDFHLYIDQNFEFKENAINIRFATLEINDSILEDSKKKEQERLVHLCYKDFEAFYSEILQSNNLLYTPFFHTLSSYKFYLLFLRSNNLNRYNIIELLKSKYSKVPAPELLIERDFFEKLQKNILKKIKSLPKSGISPFLFKELNRIISLIISSYNPI